MREKRRDRHGFFALDNAGHWLPPPPLFLRKCSFQTSLGSQLLQAFSPEAARVLVLEAAEGGIGQAANFALEFFFAARTWVGRSRV